MNKRNTNPLRIGQLAKLAGVKPDSVRFYERSRLLPKPARLASGYRVYDEAALKRLQFIKQAQALGFSLDEVGRILRLREQGKPACQAVVAMAEATLAEKEGQLKELETFTRGLRRHVERWRKFSAGGKKCAAEFCELIESAKEAT